MSSDTFKPSRDVPVSRGLAWLVQSLALLRMQPGRLLLIAVFMQLILGLTQMPIVGMLVTLSVPALGAGILEAFEVTGRGGRPGISMLFKPLTSGTHSGRLFMMGLLVFAVGILSISVMLSGSEAMLDPELVSRIEQGDIDALTELDPGSISKMVMAFMVGIAISGTLSYFTIPLIWFGNRKLGPALVEGIKALVIHWKPFLMLALGLLAISIPVILVAGFLFGMAGSGGLLSAMIMACILFLLLAFQMLLFATQYCAFRDIFGMAEGSEPPATEDDSQLLA